MIEGSGVAEQLGLPVGVCGSQKRTLRRRHDSGGDLLVDVGTVLVACNKVQFLGRPGAADVEVVLYAGASAETLLCLDQHDAVRGARAVDRRRGILEDRDRLNVGRIQQSERAARKRRRGANRDTCVLGLDVVDRHPIDHVERLVGGADRAATADRDLRAGTGLTAVLGDLHAGGATFDHLIHVWRDADVGGSGVYRCNRSSDGDATLRAIAGGDDILERNGLPIDRENDRSGAVCRDHHNLDRRAEADASGPHCLRACRYATYGKGAIGSGNRSAARAFDKDVDVGYRLLSGGVNHSSGNSTCGRDRGLCAE